MDQWFLRLGNDRSRRDCVSGGAAAGVAGAFGSPVGGICFAMEEASSFWALSLTWRTYLATMSTVFVLWTLQAWRDGLAEKHRDNDAILAARLMRKKLKKKVRWFPFGLAWATEVKVLNE